LFALAATLWQKAALSLTGVSVRHPKSFLFLLTRWVWLLGLVAQIVGVCLQAAALDRGRVSIIQPLLVTTVIWALPLGYFLTNQAIGTRETMGAAIIVVGLALFASFGDPAAGVDNAPASDWAASILVIGTACAALLLFANRGSLSARAALLGTIAGLLYGLSATLMKPVVEGLHADGLVDVIAGWEFWVWAVAGIVGFFVQQLRSRPAGSCHRWRRCRWRTRSSASCSAPSSSRSGSTRLRPGTRWSRSVRSAWRSSARS
jgi:drug/metabolite transporter (DMT)-like permease